RGTGIEHDPHRQRAVAFGLANEEAIAARVQLPIDAPRLVARFVAAVLGEFQPRALVAAAMLAAAAQRAAAPRGDAQPAQLRAQARRDGIPAHDLRDAQPPGYGTSRSSAATTSSGRRPSASAANESSNRWRSTGAASASTSSRVAASLPCSNARALEASTSDWPARGPAPHFT